MVVFNADMVEASSFAFLGVSATGGFDFFLFLCGLPMGTLTAFSFRSATTIGTIDSAYSTLSLLAHSWVIDRVPPPHPYSS